MADDDARRSAPSNVGRCEVCSCPFDLRERSQVVAGVVCRPCGLARWRDDHPVVVDRIGELRARMPVVYRCLAADGELLYVGSSSRLRARLEDHRATKPWWTEVARVTWEPARTVAAARARELEAIRELEPRHNRQGLPLKRQGADLGPTEVFVGPASA